MQVVFSRKARSQLLSLFRYLSQEASPAITFSYTEAITEHCLNLKTFSRRGTKRDDIYPDLRTMDFRRKVTIAFLVKSKEVVIIGIFYGGQNYEAVFKRDT